MKKLIFVSFPDNDFMLPIRTAFTVLTQSDDFLNATLEAKKIAIAKVAGALSYSNSYLRFGNAIDHYEYIVSKLRVSYNAPIDPWDVEYCYDPYTMVVY